MNLNIGAVTRWGLNLLALLGVIVALRCGQTILIPLVIALLLAALVWPAVRFLHRTIRLPWAMACILMVLMVVAANVLVSVGIGLVVPKFLQDLPHREE